MRYNGKMGRAIHHKEGSMQFRDQGENEFSVHLEFEHAEYGMSAKEAQVYKKKQNRG
ncbi:MULTISPECIES: YrzK family protein [Bacillus]|uniref:Uncharacterized protein n=1 Tax=Bacillus capparidis TaxID=1840411 RepID=A0ABS4CTS3_9BACI|nr:MULTISPECIES: YrzK family protein [Bacillus]MBP1080926.1 hypothetical protein [Bacillus capparidis]MED1097562.1 hypothetical protein [Bacillus capparidis]